MFNSVSRTYCHVTAIFIRILVCDTLTVFRCDRMPFFTRGQEKIFRDPFGGKCLSVKDVFHLTQSFHSFPDSLHRPMYFPRKYKITAQLLLSNEKLDFSLEEESLVTSDDHFIPILAAVSTYMRRDLHRNQGF